MPDDRHLHNAAATLQAILTHRQPEYAWIVDVRLGEHAPSPDPSAAETERRSAEGAGARDDEPV